MRNKLKSTRTTIICCIVIGILLIGLSVYIAFGGAEEWLRQQGTEQTLTVAPTPTQVILPTSGDTDATVLVIAVDAQQNQIVVYEPERDAEYELEYSGTTDIRDRFGNVIAGVQVDVATIANVSFDAESGAMYSLRQTEPDWHYRKQSSVEVNREKGILKIAGNHYRLPDSVVVMDEGKRIAITELASVDELTVMGMGDRVYYIERSKGHGTLLLQSADAFVGGALFIDGKKAEEVKSDMSLIVREGAYLFALECGDLYASNSLVISKDAVVQWDLSEFLPKEPMFGRVEFLLEPTDATLYIDNRMQENMAFAELEYGEHIIGLYKDGYVSWTGKITVSSAEMVFSVALVPEVLSPTPVPTEMLSPTPIPTQNIPTPEVSATPAPTVPEVGQEVPVTEEDERKEIQIIWYPTSVVSVDSVYVGTTDAAGVLRAKLRYGTHVFELTRVLLDGSTLPKKCMVNVSEETTSINFFLID